MNRFEMKFRYHRGGLDDSLKTTINVDSEQDLINHMNSKYSHMGATVEEIDFYHVGFDERINWDTYYVSCRLKGESEWFVAGMSDGIF
jgi:hypothetical protein